MVFNVYKCVAIHMGKHNRKASIKINSKSLKSSEEERDLGIEVHKSSKSSRQCTKKGIGND